MPLSGELILFFFKFNITIMRQDSTVHRQLPKHTPGLLLRSSALPHRAPQPDGQGGPPSVQRLQHREHVHSAKLAAKVVSNGSVVQQQDLAGRLGLTLLPQVDCL